MFRPLISAKSRRTARRSSPSNCMLTGCPVIAALLSGRGEPGCVIWTAGADEEIVVGCWAAAGRVFGERTVNSWVTDCD